MNLFAPSISHLQGILNVCVGNVWSLFSEGSGCSQRILLEMACHLLTADVNLYALDSGMGMNRIVKGLGIDRIAG
jgi:hypothetical protein